MTPKCRIWWPEFLSSTEPSSSSHLLFGWFISCSSTCIDIVVAFSCDTGSLSGCQSSLQEILSDTNRNMPLLLQNKSVFALLGEGAAYPPSNGKMVKVGMGGDSQRSTNGSPSATNGQDVIRENHGGRSCGCHQPDGLQEKNSEAYDEDSCWIHLVYDFNEQYGRDIHRLPKLHHIHWNGQILSQFDVHVIAYETPIYGLHHFSLNSWNLFEQVNAPMKKPKWVDELERNRHLLDLDTVVLAINCATAAAKIVIDKHMDSKRSYASFSIIYLSTAFIRHVFAISAASVSTLYYVVLQLICNFSHMGCKTEIYKALARILCTTCTNIQIRCCQFSYWPIFLQDNGLRSQSCVEFEENAAFLRHSMWSSLVVDLLLGNLFGLPLLFNAESAYLWLSTLSRDITNDLLRSGCVWLMGVPAGFKLNTELAGVLGMISLNVIQIWSTLWTLAGSLLIYFIKGFAVFGIIFGATIPAALVMDMISLATFHLSILHCAMSLLYSWQIQALAALWRLFRGRKWNPLRHRLDSYDYTVKQHTVGSLLFTPLLLLLPTTSVFYIFFTILNATITFICAFFELSISLIHGTPYSKILLWLVRRRRFPSGIWFEIVSCHIGSLEIVFPDKTGSSHDNSQKDMDTAEERSTIVVSALHSNFLSLGELVFPHYKKIFSGVLSFVISSAHGALIGTRTSSTLGTGLPPIYPRMIIPGKEYWCLCYNSILSCTTKHDRHLGQ